MTRRIATDRRGQDVGRVCAARRHGLRAPPVLVPLMDRLGLASNMTDSCHENAKPNEPRDSSRYPSKRNAARRDEMNPFIFAGSAPLTLIHGPSISCDGLGDRQRRKRTAHLKRRVGRLSRTAPPCSASLPTLIHGCSPSAPTRYGFRILPVNRSSASNLVLLTRLVSSAKSPASRAIHRPPNRCRWHDRDRHGSKYQAGASGLRERLPPAGEPSAAGVPAE